MDESHIYAVFSAQQEFRLFNSFVLLSESNKEDKILIANLATSHY